MKAGFISLFMAALLLGGSASTGFTQEGRDQHPGRAGMSQEEIMEMCRQMMERHEAMREKMAEKDKRLQGLVERMNASTGNEKIEAMSEVINEMVDQRQQMHEMMMKMGPGMMGHMMQHMHPEMMREMRKQCPMMMEMENNQNAEHH